MLGMHNEGDISLFWAIVVIFGSWTVRYFLDTIENVRIARWKAKKAQYDAINRSPVTEAIEVHEAPDVINEEKEDADDRLAA